MYICPPFSIITNLIFFTNQFSKLSLQNINRAIKRASEGTTGNFSESTFEAYGFGGASFVINVNTDNDNRANSDVRVAVGKNKGKMAEMGSVLFMYDRKGVLEVSGVVDEEALLEAAIESGIDEYELEVEKDEADGDVSVIYVDSQDAGAMMNTLQGMGYEKCKMELKYISKAPVEVTDEEFELNMKIVDALEELDDVDSVEHNMSN